MLKKLKELLRRDPEQFRIPRSVQEVIPIRTVWKSGNVDFLSAFCFCRQ